MAPILEVRNATKRFPGVLANDQISFSLQRGEILAFLGENGAGKSTLMNILYGLYEPDEGEITIRGEEVEIEDPNDAIRLGIGMVHQHFQLVPVFTVAENIVMGTEPTRPSFSWRTVGSAGLAGAALFLVGAFFALASPLQWLTGAALGGAVAEPGAHTLGFGLFLAGAGAVVARKGHAFSAGQHAQSFGLARLGAFDVEGRGEVNAHALMSAAGIELLAVRRLLAVIVAAGDTSPLFGGALALLLAGFGELAILIRGHDAGT